MPENAVSNKKYFDPKFVFRYKKKNKLKISAAL